LKIAAVLDGFAQAICAICNYPGDSNHASLVHAAVASWGADKGLFDESSVGATPDQVRFLHAFDLGFMRRRVRFVIAAFNWWYGSVGAEGFPTRQELDSGKALLYEKVAALDALAQLHLPEDADQSE